MNRKASGYAGVFVSLFIIAIVITVMVLMAGYDTVDASHIGVKNRFGVLKGTMGPGMQWTGLLTHVEQYNLRLRKITVEMLVNETTAVDMDGQTVKARIEVNYRLNPDNIEQAYSKIGRDKDLAAILNIEGTIREGFKSTTSKYKSEEIWQKRNEVKQAAIKVIKDNFPQDYFILENVIISDLDFNREFIAAIELQKTNERLAIAKEKEVEIAKNEADRKIEEARGIAESEALKVLKMAQAEAESLKLKAKELTPLMVQNNLLDRWDGALPQYLIIGGEDTTPNMLLQVPVLAGKD